MFTPISTNLSKKQPPAGSFEDARLQVLLAGARMTFAERLGWLERATETAMHIYRKGAAGRLDPRTGQAVSEPTPTYDATESDDPPPHTP